MRREQHSGGVTATGSVFNFPAGANSFGNPIATPYDASYTYDADYFIDYNKAAQDPDNEVDDD